MERLSFVVPRIVDHLHRGERPRFDDVLAYESGAAWEACRDGEAMLALLSACDPDLVLTALRACASDRTRSIAHNSTPAILDESVRESIRLQWSNVVRRVCPRGPALHTAL